MSWSVRRIDEVVTDFPETSEQLGWPLAPWNQTIQHCERVGDCQGCGHQYTTIAAIYTCEYCGRKA